MHPTYVVQVARSSFRQRAADLPAAVAIAEALTTVPANRGREVVVVNLTPAPVAVAPGVARMRPVTVWRSSERGG